MALPDLAVSPHCDRTAGYGLRANSGNSPRVVEFSTRRMDGPRSHLESTGRRRRHRNPLVSALQWVRAELSAAAGSVEPGMQPQLVATENGYVVAYMNARSIDDPFSGIRLRAVGPEGRPALRRSMLMRP